MKILVCGGRDFADKDFLYNILDDIIDVNLIIHGGASGADSLAGEWAKKHNIKCQVFPADWGKYGKSAGPIRNQQMLDEGKPDEVYAFPGGRGTADMIARSKKAGLKVYECRSYATQCRF